MRQEKLPITTLPAWSKLNDISFLDIAVQDLGNNKGSGLLTTRALSSKDTYDLPTLLEIPRELVLSAEAVEEHAKVDGHFRDLLQAAGGKESIRHDIMLFLLMQITEDVGVKGPWTEYCRFLPSYIPVPTMWSEEERVLLTGTSLESALSAKMGALNREFETLRVSTIHLPWCQQRWWEHETLSFPDWVLLDAWYRSRSLELPDAGESMVPCLDMANHSSEPNAYYEQSSDKNIILLLRPEIELSTSSEVTISYGDSKSDPELLFSYGFIGLETKIKSLVLPVEPFADDPLGKAKLAAFPGQPTLRLTASQDSIEWKCPFIYFMSLNEEDGLDFRVLQETDGTRSPLRVFWRESDVTNTTDTFESHIQDHALKDVFELRAVALLHDRIREQLERLYASEETIESLANLPQISLTIKSNATKLRESEISILEKAFAFVDKQKSALLESSAVLTYLESMSQEPPQEPEIDEEEDFS